MTITKRGLPPLPFQVSPPSCAAWECPSPSVLKIQLTLTPPMCLPMTSIPLPINLQNTHTLLQSQFFPKLALFPPYTFLQNSQGGERFDFWAHSRACHGWYPKQSYFPLHFEQTLSNTLTTRKLSSLSSFLWPMNRSVPSPLPCVVLQLSLIQDTSSWFPTCMFCEWVSTTWAYIVSKPALHDDEQNSMSIN